jgi:single-strand DNA-binding protein
MLKIQLIGRLGQDSIVNDVNGKKVVNFSVAHTEKYKNNQGGEVNKTIWVSCAYWTDKLNIANYLKKEYQVFNCYQVKILIMKKSKIMLI